MANILIVDDDEKICNLLHTFLRRKGHQVRTVSDGRKGVAAYRQEHPHVTILDFEMPEMDGLAVLRELRALDPKAPVIMLTGAGTDAREKQARELGVTDFLAKGFSLHELGAVLHSVLPPTDHGAETTPASQRLPWGKAQRT